MLLFECWKQKQVNLFLHDPKMQILPSMLQMAKKRGHVGLGQGLWLKRLLECRAARANRTCRKPEGGRGRGLTCRRLGVSHLDHEDLISKELEDKTRLLKRNTLAWLQTEVAARKID